MNHSSCDTFRRFFDGGRTQARLVPDLSLLGVRDEAPDDLSTARWIKGNDWTHRTPVVDICREAGFAHLDVGARRDFNGLVSCDPQRDTEASVIEDICHFWPPSNITLAQGWSCSVAEGRWTGECDLMQCPGASMYSA